MLSVILSGVAAILGGLFTYLVERRKNNLDIKKIYTNEINNILALYKEEQDKLLKNIDEYINDNKKLRDDIIELKNENKDLIKKNDELIEKVNKLIKENAECKKSFEMLKNDYNDLLNKIYKNQSKIDLDKK